jgi:hypothetical protein
MGQVGSCRLPWIEGSANGNVQCNYESGRLEKTAKGRSMIDLPYSLVVEATVDPEFFGFYSPELEGFSGVGHSVEDCLYQARWGMKEHTSLLAQQKLPVPPVNPNPTVTIRNEQPAVA